MMNYQPFFGMHLLISDDLLEASIAIGNSLIAIVAAVLAIILTYFLLNRI